MIPNKSLIIPLPLLVVWLTVIAGSFSAHADNAVYQVTAEQWATPRHGERLIKMEPVHRLINEWQQDTSAKIEISYPGGENGELWVEEMKDWLIALGVSSDKIQAIAGSGASDIIELSVVKTGGKKE